MGTRPSAVATLVERTTRYLRVVGLPGGIKAAPARAALVADLLEVAPGMPNPGRGLRLALSGSTGGSRRLPQ